MTYQYIILEHAEPGVYVLTVNRPQALNALNAATLDEIADATARGSARMPPRARCSSPARATGRLSRAPISPRCRP